MRWLLALLGLVVVAVLGVAAYALFGGEDEDGGGTTGSPGLSGLSGSADDTISVWGAGVWVIDHYYGPLDELVAAVLDDDITVGEALSSWWDESVLNPSNWW